MTIFRLIASLMVVLVLLASPGFGGEGKGASTISDKEAAVLSEILRVLRRTSGDFPKSRNDAVILVAKEMSKVSYPVSEALSPYVNYEIGNVYWHGWGEEQRDYNQAQRFYSTAASCFNGKLNFAYLMYATNAINLSGDVPLDFIALIKNTEPFILHGTDKDIYEYVDIDTALRTKSLVYREEFKPGLVETLKKEIPGFILRVTDEGSLKKYSKNAVSLKLIAEALPDTNWGKKADELHDALQKAAPK